MQVTVRAKANVTLRPSGNVLAEDLVASVGHPVDFNQHFIATHKRQ